MTILPKKKQNNKSSSEESVDTDGRNVGVAYDSYPSFGSHSHSHSHSRGHSPQTTSRWNAINQRNEDKRSATDSDVPLDSGPTLSKRRLRRDRDREDKMAVSGALRKSVAKGSLMRKGMTKALTNSSQSLTNGRQTDDAVDTCGRQTDIQSDGSSHGDGCKSAVKGQVVTNESMANECELESASGYNSGDEYEKPIQMWSKEEWEEKERVFEMWIRKKGFRIKDMGEDGACLFRAVADQIYGDQEMHESIRKLCMDYMAKNADYFSQYVTEDFTAYIERKRMNHIHGNHIEMQAMSELFNRPIEVYDYSCEPINIFQGCQQTDNEPIRLSYHKNIHYNSIVNPHKATIGVGLGLPALKPGFADKSLMDKAIHISEEQQLEQAMLEDKIRATDWEATNEAIEEQIARESYVEWLKENEMRSHKSSASACPTATVQGSGSGSACASTTTTAAQALSPRSSPKASGSGCNALERHVQHQHQVSSREFSLEETASFMHQLPPQVFGLKDWTEDDILAKVLAQSQEEYIQSLKRESNSSDSKSNTGCKTPTHSTPSSSSSSQSNS